MKFFFDLAMGVATSILVVPLIFSFCYIDGFFPPFPSETLIIALSSLSAINFRVPIVYIFIGACLGAWLGDITAYHIGRHIPLYRIPIFKNRKGKKALEVAERSLRRRGTFYILTARFVPIGRVAVNMTAGATGFPRAKFVATSFFASIFWVSYSVALGYGAGAFLHHNPIVAVVIGVSLGALCGYLIDKLITLIGNYLARRVAKGSMRFLPWITVDDIKNQGIKVDEEKISDSSHNKQTSAELTDTLTNMKLKDEGDKQ